MKKNEFVLFSSVHHHTATSCFSNVDKKDIGNKYILEVSYQDTSIFKFSV